LDFGRVQAFPAHITHATHACSGKVPHLPFGKIDFMTYPAEFLTLVDEFIHLANRLAEEKGHGEVSAAILFAAGRYNAFNFVSNNGTEQDREKAVDFYVSEYHKALQSNLDGVVGPVVKPQG
jgi:hypothetical protein